MRRRDIEAFGHLDHAFDVMDLNRVELRAASGNTASRRIAERLGFVEEGTARQAQWLYDHFVDLVVYAMLADDWRAARNQDSDATKRVSEEDSP